MTVRQVYQRALAIVFEQEGNDPDFDQYSPLLLDRLVMEALPTENMIRRAAGREELPTAPVIERIDETVIPYDDRITRIALPYGLAAVLLSDDEGRKAESVMHRNEFTNALNEASPATFETVTGWDGGEE